MGTDQKTYVKGRKRRRKKKRPPKVFPLLIIKGGFIFPSLYVTQFSTRFYLLSNLPLPGG
jgi:hypothetical protein